MTTKEQVLKLRAKGKTYRAIAEELGVGRSMVAGIVCRADPKCRNKYCQKSVLRYHQKYKNDPAFVARKRAYDAAYYRRCKTNDAPAR